jgi:putative tryptophan/tyrosine transport system substrate-binding protein
MLNTDPFHGTRSSRYDPGLDAGAEMRRRAFIGLLGGAAVAWPLAGHTQEPGRVYRIGSLHQSPADAPQHLAFVAELQTQGFLDGQNLTVDRHGYGLPVDRFAEVAQDHVKAHVDAILCGGEAAARAAQGVTQTIPLVVLVDDAIRAGLVRSLAKPGGNTTGVSILASELDGKRQDILIEAVPGLRRMAALVDPGSTTAVQAQALVQSAGARGVELSIHQVTKPEEIGPAIDAAKASGATALNVLASALLFNNRKIIFERVATWRLPAIYQWPEMAEDEGLLGYGPRIIQIYRDLVSRQVVKILRGIKPADIPVEQPTRFELVINLKAAQTIRHEVPAALVLRADKLIEG